MSIKTGDKIIAASAILLGVVVAVVLVGIVGFSIWSVQQKSHIGPCLVEDKEAVHSGDGNQYRVYTEQCGVLSVEDSIWAGRWDSADAYNSIKEGATYRFYVQGVRAPLFSMFPNVLEMKEIAR